MCIRWRNALSTGPLPATLQPSRGGRGEAGVGRATWPRRNRTMTKVAQSLRIIHFCPAPYVRLKQNDSMDWWNGVTTWKLKDLNWPHWNVKSWILYCVWHAHEENDRECTLMHMQFSHTTVLMCNMLEPEMGDLEWLYNWIKSTRRALCFEFRKYFLF